MTLFESLFVAHLVGDFLLQTKVQGLQKMHGKWWNAPLLLHCAVYTAVVGAALWWHGIPLGWLWFVGLVHLIVDRRSFVRWWRVNVNRDPEPPFWLMVVTDQIWHVLTLVIVVLFYS
jgi:hypothetical protein